MSVIDTMRSERDHQAIARTFTHIERAAQAIEQARKSLAEEVGFELVAVPDVERGDIVRRRTGNWYMVEAVRFDDTGTDYPSWYITYDDGSVSRHADDMPGSLPTVARSVDDPEEVF